MGRAGFLSIGLMPQFMAKITVDGGTLSVEVVAADAEARFNMFATFQDPAGRQQHERWELDIESRGDLTVEWIEQTLTDWADGRDDVAAIQGFEIQKIDPARRGTAADSESSPVEEQVTRVPPSMEATVPKSDVSVGPGDLIAYYVDGPDSAVYGHTTEAVVEDVPPIRKQNRDPVHGKVKINTGRDTKLIPVEWVAGPADEVDVDHPNEDL